MNRSTVLRSLAPPLGFFGAVAATPWVLWREADVLRRGVPLNEQETAFAHELGIERADAVRLLRVEAIRAFDQPHLRAITRGVEKAFATTVGLTLGHGILIREDYWREPRLVAHELVHVRQYERLGSIRVFLQSYFRECLAEGYPLGALEREAIDLSKNLFDP